jgi:hypothetical protein
MKFIFHPMGERKKFKNRLNDQPMLLDTGYNIRSKAVRRGMEDD